MTIIIAYVYKDIKIKKRLFYEIYIFSFHGKNLRWCRSAPKPDLGLTQNPAQLRGTTAYAQGDVHKD